MRYALSVEVKLQEMPDDEPVEEKPITTDLESNLGKMMNTATALLNPARVIMFPIQPAGFDFRKQVAVRVSNFSELATIIGQYEQLTRQLQVENV